MSPTALFDDYSENTLVEQPAIALFAALNWQTASLYHETFGPHSPEGRESEHQVILPKRLQQTLSSLNPHLPAEAIAQAFDELTRDRSTQTPVAANRELYRSPQGRGESELSRRGGQPHHRDREGHRLAKPPSERLLVGIPSLGIR